MPDAHLFRFCVAAGFFVAFSGCGYAGNEDDGSKGGSEPQQTSADYGGSVARYSNCTFSSDQLPEREEFLRTIISEATRNIGGYELNRDQFLAKNTVLVSPLELKTGVSMWIVYVSGNQFCGSSGCNAYVLEPVRSTDTAVEGYQLYMRIVPARLPIAVLRTDKDGWHDLGVYVSGGGIREPYMGVLGTKEVAGLANPTLATTPRTTPEGIDRVLIDRPGEDGRQCRLT